MDKETLHDLERYEVLFHEIVRSPEDIFKFYETEGKSVGASNMEWAVLSGWWMDEVFLDNLTPEQCAWQSKIASYLKDRKVSKEFALWADVYLFEVRKREKKLCR